MTRAERRGGVLLLVGLCACAAPAQVNLYVSPSGTDGTNDCREAGQPCASVAYAMTQATPNGDTLHLAAGAYTEPELVFDPVFHQNLALAGDGAGVTVLQAASAPGIATNRVLWIKSGSTNSISGVTLRHGRSSDGLASLGAGGAGENGGGLLVNGSLTLADCRIEANQSGAGGDGGVGANGGRAGDGGGIYSDGLLALLRCTVVSNATGSGGEGGNVGGRGGNGSAVYNGGGSVVLVDSTVNDNRTGDGGPGATGGHAGNGTLWNTGDLNLLNATVSGNVCGDGGAGSSNEGGHGGEGAAVWQALAGAAICSHSTIAGNAAGAGGAGTPDGDDGAGGGIFNDGGTVQLGHAIVAGNAALTQGPDIFGDAESLGYVLVQATNDATLGGILTGVQFEVDPLLGDLSDHGGPTATRSLNGASPAVNAGDPAFGEPPAADQRGSPRVQGGVIDLGAYELANGTLYVGQDGSDATNDCRLAGLPCATLEHALAMALADDVIAVSTGLYTESGLVVDKAITIEGAAAADTVVQAAATTDDASDRVLTVLEDAMCTLRRLTIRNGRSGSGPDGTESGESGGPGEGGGGILNNGWLLVDECVIASNRAGRGGDGEVGGGGSGGEGGRGGGIHNDGTLVVSNSLLAGNAGGEGGTGGDSAFGGEGGSGGGIFNDGELHIVRCTFTGNRSGSGGSGPVQGGQAGGGGGLVNNSDAAVFESEFAGNRAGDGGAGEQGGQGGGGGAFFNAGNGAVISCTFASNEAGDGGAGDEGLEGPGGSGGGIYNEDSLVVGSSTFHANSAGDAGTGAVLDGGSGGGIFSGAILALSNCTIAANSAGLPGGMGGGVFNAGDLEARHTLIGNNSAAGAGPDVWGDFTSAGYNLIEDLSDTNPGGDETGNLYGSDPLLGDLADNGGPTRTRLPQPGSPAVNAGDPAFVEPPDTDQRGVARVQGGRIDIGAVETSIAGQDADGDGLPDDWETFYGLDPFDNGTTNILNGALGDPDVDGFDNLSEFIALTDPTDPGSRFSVRGIQRASGTVVSYLSATGRLYTLQYVGSLPPQAWSNVAGQVDVPGTGGTNTLVDTEPAGSRIHRLRVRMP